ncbi:MAG: hypothetical protein U0835_24685 [Isosphaeraceae bacterium]
MLSLSGPSIDPASDDALLDQARKPSSRMDAVVEPAWSGAGLDRPLSVSVLARPRVAASAIAIEVDGRGVFEAADRSVTLPGPWAAESLAGLDLGLVPGGPGAGGASITIRALDQAGQAVATVRRELFAEYDRDGRVFGGDAGFTEIGLRRVEADLAAGKITTEEAAARSLALTTRTAVTTGDGAAGAVAPAARSFSVQAPGAFTVQGQARWLDATGGLNPIPRARVSVYDLNVSGAALVTTGTTDDSGFYSLNFTHQDEPGQGNPDLFVRIETISSFALVKPETNVNAYAISSLVALEVAPGSTLTRNVTTDNNSDDVNTAFSVHSAAGPRRPLCQHDLVHGPFANPGQLSRLRRATRSSRSRTSR